MPETLRIELAPEWLDEWDGRALDAIVAAKDGAPPAGRILRCGDCAGNLVRSHVRRYERLLTFFLKRKPYRCIDCKKRRWR
jgi:hypothetical protein